MTDDPCLLSAAEAGRRIAARRLSPVAYVEALLARIAAVEDRVHAYITVLAEPALAAARRAEAEIAAGRWRGPLHGVPFAVKDNYFTAGVRTTAGSRLMLETVPDSTAHIVTRLEAAGAILLGKLNTWEYGTGNGGIYFDLPFEPARNPWDLARFTGGSSTGAGASVAAGIAPFALGSDTGGSIRLPAAACGLAGLKATYGRVSRAGVLPNCWSLDVTGALCWTAEDSALVLNAIAGHDPADPGSAAEPVPDYRAGLHGGVAGLTIGRVAAEGVTTGIDAAAAVLERLGARLVEASLPAPLADYRRAASLINWSESLSIHEQDFRERASLMGQALRDKMTSGSLVRAADYLAAQRLRRQLARGMDAVFGGCDLLLLPGAFGVAPRLDDAAGTMAFTRESAMNVANLSGHPAMSVLTGFDAAGLPLNAQLMGRYFDEATVLRAAAALEAATPHRARRPAL
ncbi:amidase [Paeniroseomonas aquatica]|uniref:Amidase n=1 Tax=Paeniroseomonas aquatica TaxID=373043 RepID=A0ABT8AAG1_9PROT|nr:amidase [Paeniroseomonas aquatica]MDN3566658.1 amidase [Paeniroseomonas aquatica]